MRFLRPTITWTVVAALALCALAFVAAGLLAIASDGWRELYADQWRLYRIYLTYPFPLDVLMLENGHRPVFPGLVRVAELHWLEGNQLLQLFVGALMALATFALLAITAWRDRHADPAIRAIAMAMAAFAVFWLGNARMLLHGNESVHAYLLTACMAAATLLVAGRNPPGWRGLVAVCLLCFVATFCFGPGMASFAALGMLLAVRRQFRAASVVAAALAATLVIYLLLPGSTGVRNAMHLRPWDNLSLAAIWLCSLPVTLFEAVLVPGAGRSLDASVRGLLAPLAESYHARFGDIRVSYSHVAWLGFIAMGYVLWAMLDAWRKRDVGNLRLAGIATALFAMGVAGIVALGRLAYFEAHPSQVFANRYLPWSCLFWLGVSWIALGGAPSKRRNWRLAAVLPALAVVLVFGNLTNRGHEIWGKLVQQVVHRQAAAVVAGVLEPELDIGETVFTELVDGLPLVKGAGISMFRWPEARVQGQPVPLVADGIPPPQPAAVETRIVDNRFEPDRQGLRIRVRLPSADARMPRRLLVLDREGMAAGVLVRNRVDPGWTHEGFARIDDPERIGAIAELRNGLGYCLAACPSP